MIHIAKAKRGYIVIYCGKNGEVLSTSEIFTTKQNAINNIVASSKNFFKFILNDEKLNNELKDNFVYQDDTYKTPKLFWCSVNHKENKINLYQLTEEVYKTTPLVRKHLKFSIRKPKYKKHLQKKVEITDLANKNKKAVKK